MSPRLGFLMMMDGSWHAYLSSRFGRHFWWWTTSLFIGRSRQIKISRSCHPQCQPRLAPSTRSKSNPVHRFPKAVRWIRRQEQCLNNPIPFRGYFQQKRQKKIHRTKTMKNQYSDRGRNRGLKNVKEIPTKSTNVLFYLLAQVKSMKTFFKKQQKKDGNFGEEKVKGKQEKKIGEGNKKKYGNNNNNNNNGKKKDRGCPGPMPSIHGGCLLVERSSAADPLRNALILLSEAVLAPWTSEQKKKKGKQNKRPTRAIIVGPGTTVVWPPCSLLFRPTVSSSFPANKTHNKW